MDRFPVLVDLFCGAGGAAAGYARAGFRVIGVDSSPQPRYPFEFLRADVRELDLGWFARRGAVAVHASPPCQRYSRSVTRANRERHPDLLAWTRSRLELLGLPFVIENVEDAGELFQWERTQMLCGSAFGRAIRRHRLFECHGFWFLSPGCAHAAYPRRFTPAYNRTRQMRVLSYTAYGDATPERVAAFRSEMECEWMIAGEVTEAIPPYFTELVGTALMAALKGAGMREVTLLM